MSNLIKSISFLKDCFGNNFDAIESHFGNGNDYCPFYYEPVRMVIVRA